MFWWAAVGAAAAALDGMLIDSNGNLLVRRQNDGVWKRDGTITGSALPGTTSPQTTTSTSTADPNLLALVESAVRSKAMVVGSIACAGLVG